MSHSGPLNFIYIYRICPNTHISYLCCPLLSFYNPLNPDYILILQFCSLTLLTEHKNIVFQAWPSWFCLIFFFFHPWRPHNYAAAEARSPSPLRGGALASGGGSQRVMGPFITGGYTPLHGVSQRKPPVETWKGSRPGASDQKGLI